MTTVQNLVLPTDHERLPLYADAEGLTVRSRTSAAIGAGGRASFATYFNAFPATYWVQYTAVRELTLRLHLTGSGRVVVSRSGRDGDAWAVTTRAFTGGEVTVSLALTGFESGGWLWFDVEAHGEVELLAGRWEVPDAQADGRPTAADRSAGTTIGITTVNKPDFCVRTLQALAQAPEVLDVVDRICVIDQGERKVAAEPGTAELTQSLGGRLRLIDQANLGGSGGFSRGMLEALEAGSASALIMDDDVAVEPDSVLRAVRFAAACPAPTVVGGHMLDLQHPTVLHSWSEVVDQATFMWGAADRSTERHDLAATGLRQTPWMHRVGVADYNGWWMCLLPVEVLDRVGLAAPYFIKWDDAEFGLRAGEAGYRTVSLPGVALWHVSWLDKDDTIDWQAYFHERNRLVTALLHATQPRGGHLLREYRRLHLKQLLCLQYYAVTLRHRALRDVLRGPEHLPETLATAIGEARALAQRFPETRVRPFPDGVAPPQEHSREPRPGPKGLRLALFTLQAVTRHLGAPVRHRQPQRLLPKGEATWWHMPSYDSVLVESADRSGVLWYRRDRRRFARLWWDSLRLTWTLARRWPQLSAAYRRRWPELTSPQRWAAACGRGSDDHAV
ncbi:MAG TPA: glycosyltransferase [Micromonosporaceae bacterium]|nr:glycosyltransferase [Micromonosporaceae bacterium]